jgi:hypothetical protein
MFTNDFTVQITKKVTLEKWNNSMSTGEKILVYGRIINAEKTRCRKFKFVLFIDGFDYAEWLDYEERKNTLQAYKDYIDELICSYTMCINGYNDTKEFFEMCTDSINRYNEQLSCYY